MSRILVRVFLRWVDECFDGVLIWKEVQQGYVLDGSKLRLNFIRRCEVQHVEGDKHTTGESLIQEPESTLSLALQIHVLAVET